MDDCHFSISANFEGFVPNKNGASIAYILAQFFYQRSGWITFCDGKMVCVDRLFSPRVYFMERVLKNHLLLGLVARKKRRGGEKSFVL